VLGYGAIDWMHVFRQFERNDIDICKIALTLEPRDENDLVRGIEFLRENIGITF